MTKEKKELLLKDLCSRLPYRVMCNVFNGKYDEDMKLSPSLLSWDTNDIKPYLRPMSSMTDKEKDYVIHLADFPCAAQICEKKVDFLLSHHIDWRGLLPKGLALEAPEGMYKF